MQAKRVHGQWANAPVPQATVTNPVTMVFNEVMVAISPEPLQFFVLKSKETETQQTYCEVFIQEMKILLNLTERIFFYSPDSQI